MCSLGGNFQLNRKKRCSEECMKITGSETNPTLNCLKTSSSSFFRSFDEARTAKIKNYDSLAKSLITERYNGDAVISHYRSWTTKTIFHVNIKNSCLSFRCFGHGIKDASSSADYR